MKSSASSLEDDAFHKLKQSRIAFGSLNGVDDLSTHPQLRRMEVATPTGPVIGVAPPVRWHGETFAPRPIPSVNQHGDALRKEFAA